MGSISHIRAVDLFRPVRDILLFDQVRAPEVRLYRLVQYYSIAPIGGLNVLRITRRRLGSTCPALVADVAIRPLGESAFSGIGEIASAGTVLYKLTSGTSIEIFEKLSAGGFSLPNLNVLPLAILAIREFGQLSNFDLMDESLTGGESSLRII
ncbi:hypothetical protein ACFWF7_29335 [Nocardia sp. NPDC060256]|uniref:hypothetical protein n=1 Tax=unclassified Nocardia TaxID=2637762 RepID=UPI0036696C87